jgi:hypothetical protein
MFEAWQAYGAANDVHDQCPTGDQNAQYPSPNRIPVYTNRGNERSDKVGYEPYPYIRCNPVMLRSSHQVDQAHNDDQCNSC